MVHDKDLGLSGFCCYGDSARVPLVSDMVLILMTGVWMWDLECGQILTGQGKGYRIQVQLFSKNLWISEFQPVQIRLTVTLFNSRAIHLYKKLGFATMRTFTRGPLNSPSCKGHEHSHVENGYHELW